MKSAMALVLERTHATWSKEWCGPFAPNKDLPMKKEENQEGQKHKSSNYNEELEQSFSYPLILEKKKDEKMPGKIHY